MNLLAIETSSPACSVALSLGRVVTEKHEVLNNQHSAYLLDFIEELMSSCVITKHDLDAIAVGIGPGSFTGLRLGMGVAQGLAYGLNIPLVPVSSLLAVAAQSDQSHLFVAIDARMGEVYWQCFRKFGESSFKPLSEPELSKPGEIVLPQIDGDWFGLGSGWDQYSNQLWPHTEKESNWVKGILPKASIVARQAEVLLKEGWVDAKQQVLPSYVRNKVTD